MVSATMALQRALWETLTADSSIMSLVTGVFDDVPPGSSLPYVTIGNDIVTDWSAVNLEGREHRLTVVVWDRAFSAGNCRLIASRVEESVLGMPRTIQDHRVASLRFLRSFVTKDPDGSTRAVLEFNAKTQSISA